MRRVLHDPCMWLMFRLRCESSNHGLSARVRSEDIFKEIDLLCGMNHENVIFLKEYFEEGNKVRPLVPTAQHRQHPGDGDRIQAAWTYA